MDSKISKEQQAANNKAQSNMERLNAGINMRQMQIGVRKPTVFDDLNALMDSTDLIKQAALNATNELLKKNGMTPIDLAKEAIKRKEETRMARAKNE